jgi:hypothetical protein
MTPMRANIAGPSGSATSNSACIAGLPFVGVVLCLGQFGDVFCGVAKCDEQFPTRQ